MTPRLKSILSLAFVMGAFLVSSTLGLAQSQTEITQAIPITGAITGQVVSSAGDPLPGAVVYAAPVGIVRSPRSAKTDKHGNFRIDELPAGAYRLTPVRPGFTFTAQVTRGTPDFYHLGDSVTLTMTRGGVITGQVTGPSGPLIDVGIYAIRIRSEAGKLLPTPVNWRERITDDRGIYRIYGLPPGGYLVVAAKPRIGMVAPSAYDHDTPTYFPSGPRDAATEITLREGEEIIADIQYRAEPGYAITGKVFGIVEGQDFRSSATINLIDVRNRTAVFSTGATSHNDFYFALTGVPDGEYELSASQYLQTREELRSLPQKVIIRGQDTTQIKLTLVRQAVIEGRLVFETDARNNCGKRRDSATQETVVLGRRVERSNKTTVSGNHLPIEPSSALARNLIIDVGDERGRFALSNLPAGTYRIDPLAPSVGWYLRSITTTAPMRTRVPQNQDHITVRSGERFSGLTITFAEGAATMRGVISAPEGQRLPEHTFVYLVPAEKNSVTNLLRYFEAPVTNGSFAFDNVAPGNYLITAWISESDLPEAMTIRANSDLRSAVTQAAERSKRSVTLRPCEGLVKYELPWTPNQNP